ncbi:MAG: AgmX/PglI C-terminal domain-containing protein [Desulfobacteraceae bacterium]
MNTSILAEELAPLNAQIDKARQHQAVLEEQLRKVDAKLDEISGIRQRYDALGEVCGALDKLGELEAGDLFWKGLAENGGAAQHLNTVRERVARFEGKISGILEKQAALQSGIEARGQELDMLYEQVRDCHEREERRKEEFVIEREISEVPFRDMIMPWTKHAESERRFRRAVLVALMVSFLFGTIFHLVTVPVTKREVAEVKIPKRLAKLVKKEPIRPIPPPKKIAKKEEQKPKPKDESKPDKGKPVKPKKGQVTKVAKKAGGGARRAARRQAERVGVLAFKSSFSDLMDETPIAKLGTDARISKASPRVAGQAVAQRSLVTIQAKGGSSGGIGSAKFSRNVGSGNGNGLGGSGIGKGGSRGNGAGFEDVESTLADIAENDRPLSDGPGGAGRTDEEIQIIFDRYKATLYRIYNRELRKDPTLKGKILLRINIETNGAVSMCKVESTDLDSPELVAKIVARIKRFNFGPKEGVPTITILYPIDFLPAG